ncbi:hypothetical protein BT96DRAFT_814006 [Gymnopus androsaceus JB14]|uniref:Sortilin N-terminal domain-containing protein n=1 Tax=Gymnopus androsaceus JB14 TaxID=1447944 RepID=A0A6A4I4T4_9AGAR|nr:hypothetical protein BT96DRAFT_814006 [Gymnopus androsaceus JB14]
MYSSPSIIGVIMAVGNVGKPLASYTKSDIFLSCNGGFTWEEFVDSGGILIIANDQQPTDHVLFSVNQSVNWQEYKFTDKKICIRLIITVRSDTTQRFILMGKYTLKQLQLVVVHIDFLALTNRQCTFYCFFFWFSNNLIFFCRCF